MFNLVSRSISCSLARRSVDSSRIAVEQKSSSYILSIHLQPPHHHSNNVSLSSNSRFQHNTSQNRFPSFETLNGRHRQQNRDGSFQSKIAQAIFATGLVVYGIKKYMNVRKAYCLENTLSESDSTVEVGDTPSTTSTKRVEADVIGAKFKGWKIRLYQYQTCPFCCKARSFLQLHDIPFEMVEVHPIFKSEIKFSEYKKVPLITLEDADGNLTQINDSSLIISALSSYIVNDDVSLAETLEKYPTTVEVDEKGKEKKSIMNRHYVSTVRQDYPGEVEARIRDEAKWRAWVDDYLVHLISPNVYRTMYESYQAFDYHVSQGKFHGTWEGTVAKYGGAVAMYGVSKMLKKRHELNDNVRLDLYRACNHWVAAIGKGNKFMGGDKPNLADVSVYGVLSVMENLTVWDDLLSHSRIKKWYYRTKKFVENHDGRSLFEDVDS